MKWSAHDESVLIERYAEGGSRACLPHLEVKRTSSAINMKARKLGLQKNRQYRRQEMTPQLLKELQRAYTSGERGRLTRLAEKYGVELGWLKYQARTRGMVSPTGRHHWHEQADAIIHECQGMGPSQTRRRLRQAGYHYSLSAVAHRIHSLGVSCERDDGFPASVVAQMLGVDHHVVMRWVRQGALATKRRDTAYGETYQYHWIGHKALKRFLVEYAAEWDMRRVQPPYQPVILDVLTSRVA